ncbi:MAG: SUMF1/EgtB/PvdO family nonheme iron enzyme [Verrucomicrobia bacterium]|nr:SUMF1/EgtB/PvdO family nonheme iron enzyme [Verrucomicrobiota bacterium]
MKRLSTSYSNAASCTMNNLLIPTLLILISAEAVYTAEPAKEITIDLGGAKLEMVLIPVGSFTMGAVRGDRDEYPPHKVNITKPFYMSKYELRQDQWSVVMDGPAPGKFKNAKNPVESVDRKQTADFLKKLNEKLGGKPFIGRGPLDLKDLPRTLGTYYLPSEAEWEYACRAGSATRYCFGDDAKSLGEYAWFYGNSTGKAQPVGTKKPNAWGLHDMHGNVWELCRDEYFADYYTISPTDNPQGMFTTHRHVTVVRGGGWSYSAKSSRSAERGYLDMAHHRERSDALGLRIARTVEEK